MKNTHNLGEAFTRNYKIVTREVFIRGKRQARFDLYRRDDMALMDDNNGLGYKTQDSLKNAFGHIRLGIPNTVHGRSIIFWRQNDAFRETVLDLLDYDIFPISELVQACNKHNINDFDIKSLNTIREGHDE